MAMITCPAAAAASTGVPSRAPGTRLKSLTLQEDSSIAKVSSIKWVLLNMAYQMDNAAAGLLAATCCPVGGVGSAVYVLLGQVCALQWHSAVHRSDAINQYFSCDGVFHV